MLHRLTAAILSALGLLVIGLGVASATVWRGDDVLVASATAPEGAALLVADPGVLDLAGDPVTVTVEAAADTPVVIAVGRDTDVTGWVGEDAHLRVTGLSSWDQLRTEAVAAANPADDATEAPATDEGAATEDGTAPDSAATDEASAGVDEAVTAADPRGSDLWVAEATGDGAATLTWEDQPGRWSLIVASVGSEAPTLTMSWPRAVSTPWLVPSLVVGGILLVASLVLGVRQWRRARRGPVEPEWHAVLTGAIPAVTGTVGSRGSTDGLTRRQLRELRAGGVATLPSHQGAGPAPDAESADTDPVHASASASHRSSISSPASPSSLAGASAGAAAAPSWLSGGRRGAEGSDSTPAGAGPRAQHTAPPTAASAPADRSHAAPSPAAPTASSPPPPAPASDRSASRRPSWLLGRPADEAPAAASVPPPAHVSGASAPASWTAEPGASASSPSGQDGTADDSRRRRELPTLGSRWVSRGARPTAPPISEPEQSGGPGRPLSRAELRRPGGDSRRAAEPRDVSAGPTWGAMPSTGRGPDAVGPTGASGASSQAPAAQPSWPHVGDSEAVAARGDAWRRAWGIPGGTAPADDEPGRDPEESEHR